ncbi:MAG: VanW family protein [Caldilineaceae bacterium]|nr:VanW family protein [Caldilineaceae bacterium]
MHSTLSLPRGSLPPQMRRRLERSPVDFAILFFLLLLLTIIAGSITWQFWHTNRIYGGVQVAGVSIGGLTRAAALQKLEQQLPAGPSPAVSLQYGDQQWPVSAAQVAAQTDLLGAVNQAYLVGRQGSWANRLVGQGVALLGGTNIQPVVTFHTEGLRQALRTIAAQVSHPGQAARQIGEVMLPAEAGVTVDIEGTLSRLLTALQSPATPTLVRTPLAVVEMAPPVAAAPTATALTTQHALPAPLQLYDNRYGLQLALDPVLLNKIILQRDPIQLDEATLRQQLTTWAQQLDIQPQDARLRFNAATGGITVIQQSQMGRQLDIEATFAAAREALLNQSSQAQLVMVEAAPAVDMNRVAEMGIRELVASGTSYFQGSSAARVHNIVVAAEKFEGLVIPPGGIFSFNEGVEDVSAANGFEDSLIIWGDQTATGVGGGVCQVSTTVFRAAYNAGLPIVERYNHGYVVSWYGEPGLDATIYTPTVDFRFRNDTGAYLLIDPVVDASSGVLTFNLYGTKPNRQVTVGAPQQRDIKEPSPPEYRVDAAMAAGQQKQVEWEQRGMTVSVTRTIVENGTTRTDTITSHYQPWRAVYLVAPGSQLPTPSAPAADPLAETDALTEAPAEGP